MMYYSFLETNKDSSDNTRNLLKQHYIDCCSLVGEKPDRGYENYFNSLDDDSLKRMLEFLNVNK